MYLMMQLADLGSIAYFKDERFVISERVYENVRDKVGDDRERIVQFIFKDIAKGLLYLHETANLANRDLKPENILFATTKGGTNNKLEDRA